MGILEKTINEMPNSFTSNEFNKRAIKNGYSARMLKNKGLSSFIRKHADNAYIGSKTWLKKESKMIPMLEKEPNLNSMNDEEMIKHLKSKGYKILKSINEWIEC